MPENGSANENVSSREEKLHRDHIKKMKNYKKRKTRYSVMIALEALLLIILVVGFILVDFLGDFWDNGINHAERVTLEPLTTQSVQSTTTKPPAKPSSSSSSTLPSLGPLPITSTIAPSETTAAPPETTTPEYVEPIRPTDGTGYTTFVVFGVDARNTKNLLKNTQGDVVMIVSVNNSTKEVNISSVYRDFYFEANTGYFCKITDAYARFGAAAVVAAINRNFDLRIENYVVINWYALAKIITLLGGLDLNITAKEAEALGNYIYETEAATGIKGQGIEVRDGLQHLDGIAVVCYCRIRKGVGDDFARTERQRKVIAAVLQTVKSQFSLGMINKAFKDISGDIACSFEAIEVLAMLRDYQRYNIQGTGGFPSAYKASDYIYADDFESNVIRLHQFLYHDYGYSPSATVKSIAKAHASEVEQRWN